MDTQKWMHQINNTLLQINRCIKACVMNTLYADYLQLGGGKGMEFYVWNILYRFLIKEASSSLYTSKRVIITTRNDNSSSLNLPPLALFKPLCSWPLRRPLKGLTLWEIEMSFPGFISCLIHWCVPYPWGLHFVKA